MAKAKGTGATGRTRNFATVVYPESAPDRWQERLEQEFIPAFISPLHDQDNDPTGEPKKPHFHVVIMYDSVKTIQQAGEVFARIGGVGCEVVQSIRGYSRYLCHMDNPDKHQYDKEAVIQLCGADYHSTIGLVTDKYKAIKEMMEYCNMYDVTSYSDLMDYCSESRFDWFRVLCDNGTMVIKEYLKARTWKSDVINKRTNKDIMEEFLKSIKNNHKETT